MTETNFKPIFDYIDQKETSILEAVRIIVRSELGDINTNVANLAGQVKDFHDEMAIMGFRTNRLEKWAVPVGKKVGLPLDL